MVARAEIWWYAAPRIEARPYLILTRDTGIPVLNQILAAPTTRRARGIPTEVPLDESDGMPEPCVVSLDNVTLVRPVLCTERITRLGPERMEAVCAALRAAIDC